MPVYNSSGTQLCVINTEHTLGDLAGNKYYSAYIDTFNMASGDTLEIRVYVKAKAGGTSRIIYGPPSTTLTGAQVEQVQFIAPLPCPTNQWKLTIKQTAGTGRNYDWGITEQ